MMLLEAAAHMVDPSTISTSSAPLILFWIFSAVVLGGAILTIFQTNMVAAVMSLVATFFGLAAIYAMLSAHFIAALQVLVYAGAIMVLFIFVVMVLNKDEAPRPMRGLITKMIGAISIVSLMFTLMPLLDNAVPGGVETPSADFGTVANVGDILFNDYLFAFEAVSILLLIAVIAAVVVARTHKQEVVEEGHLAEHEAMPEATIEASH